MTPGHSDSISEFGKGAQPTLCRDCVWNATALPLKRCPRCDSPRLIRHQELDQLTIAHIDCDAFYASVEKRDRPELRDLPLIVGGGVRGVVTTCCYIARTFGVRSAMPMFKALRACPGAVVLRPDFAKYRAESRRIMDLMGALTPLVQPLSLDEAWMNLSGTERLNGGSPASQLVRLQARIEKQIGLTVSVGLAANKVMAKIASDIDKPRGFAVIGAADAKMYLADKPVRLLPGVGPVLAKTLEQEGIRRIGDLSARGAKALVQRHGAQGLRLAEMAEGRDVRVVDPNEVRKGISAETTFNIDLSDKTLLEDELWRMCEKVAVQARAKGVAGRTAGLKLRTSDFRILSRRRTLPHPVQTATMLFHVVRELLAPELDGRTFRLIGAGLSELVDASEAHNLLFSDGESRARIKEDAVDKIRTKFGKDAVVSARTLKPPSLQ